MKFPVPSMGPYQIISRDPADREKAGDRLERIQIRKNNVFHAAAGGRIIGIGSGLLGLAAQVSQMDGFDPVQIHEGDHGRQGKEEQRKSQSAFHGQTGTCFSGRVPSDPEKTPVLEGTQGYLSVPLPKPDWRTGPAHHGYRARYPFND